ncbi:MAG: hypothetical protein MJZ16_04555 [Bacteroidales bacterium]|nr:hypothetical protein [Bacteroidales bacterium]
MQLYRKKKTYSLEEVINILVDREKPDIKEDILDLEYEGTDYYLQSCIHALRSWHITDKSSSGEPIEIPISNETIEYVIHRCRTKIKAYAKEVKNCDEYKAIMQRKSIAKKALKEYFAKQNGTFTINKFYPDGEVDLTYEIPSIYSGSRDGYVRWKTEEELHEEIENLAVALEVMKEEELQQARNELLKKIYRPLLVALLDEATERLGLKYSIIDHIWQYGVNVEFSFAKAPIVPLYNYTNTACFHSAFFDYSKDFMEQIESEKTYLTKHVNAYNHIAGILERIDKYNLKLWSFKLYNGYYLISKITAPKSAIITADELDSAEEQLLEVLE